MELPRPAATRQNAGLIFGPILNGQILWLPPRIEDFDESLRDWLGGDWRFLSEAVLIPESAWTNLHRLCSRLPAAHRFPRAVRRDLMRLWQWDMPSAVDVERPYQLEGWPAGTALASEPLDLDATSTVICSHCEWCQSEPEGAVAGRFVRLEDWGGQVNIVYFDVQPPQEWRAFGVGLENGFVIATDWVFQNGTADPEISDTEGPPKIEECHDLNRHRDGAKDVRQRFPR
jgi:hypothetical protein